MTEGVIFTCQFCKSKINLTGNLDFPDGRGPGSRMLNASIYDNPRVDESFIVLDDKRPGPVSNKSLEESFVVLAGSASVIRQPANHTLAPHPPSDNHNASGFGLDAKLAAVAALFEMASTKTRVDHPLCLDCASQLKDEIEAQIKEAEREIAAYSSALIRLEGEEASASQASNFEAEMEAAIAEEEIARRKAEALEASLAEAEKEFEELQAASRDLDALEERYWHDYNDYQLQLRHHVEDRDALLMQMELVTQRLQLLKSTTVLNDAFKIWHDGPFGTISGFRLGRTPDVPVEWDEINAAWGQAVLLLATMAKSVSLTLPYRLQPCGSHPRIVDKNGTMELFGPAGKLWGGSYDKAMVAYLACLKEFGEWAARQDAADPSVTQVFKFPFSIEGDKVNNYTIKILFNKDARWTKALKFMLANLKYALNWLVRQEALAETPRLSQLSPESMTGHDKPDS